MSSATDVQTRSRRRHRLSQLIVSHTKPEPVKGLASLMTTGVHDVCIVVHQHSPTVGLNERRVADPLQAHLYAQHEHANWGSWSLMLQRVTGVAYAFSADTL